MAKTTKITAKEANALGLALRRSGFSRHIVLARLLIEAWVWENGQINSDWFVQEGACLKGKFSNLRNSLVKQGWIYFNESTYRYIPSKKLLPYIQKFEKLHSACIADLMSVRSDLELKIASKADQTEINALRDDIKDIRAQLNLLFARLDACNAPPPDAAKQEEARVLTHQIRALLTTHSIH